jgi:hypothetical protein
MPKEGEHSPFDYGVMRQQAYNRCQQEMLELEVLALRADGDLQVEVCSLAPVAVAAAAPPPGQGPA